MLFYEYFPAFHDSGYRFVSFHTKFFIKFKRGDLYDCIQNWCNNQYHKI